MHCHIILRLVMPLASVTNSSFSLQFSLKYMCITYHITAKHQSNSDVTGRLPIEEHGNRIADQITVCLKDRSLDNGLEGYSIMIFLVSSCKSYHCFHS